MPPSPPQLDARTRSASVNTAVQRLGVLDATNISSGYLVSDHRLLRRRLHQDRSVVLDCPERVPRDFPQVPVGVGEVAGVAAPEGVARFDENLRARGARLLHRGV